MVECKICHKLVKSNLGLGVHLKMHNISFRDYEYEHNNKRKYCKICNKEIKYNRSLCGDKSCSSELRKKIANIPENKEKARNNRFNYLKKKLGKTAWERRFNGQMSHLEQWFYDFLYENNLFDKYDIVNEYSFYPYFIDFAFLNIKLAVELDGFCHFKNGNERKEHDEKKNEFLVSRGWSVYRIAYFEQSTLSLEKFLEYIKNLKTSEPKIFKNELLKTIDIKIKIERKPHGNQYKNDKNKIEYEQKILERTSIIRNSNIDFSKFKWSGEVSKLTGLSHSHVLDFMRKYCSDILDKAYIRRGAYRFKDMGSNPSLAE